MISYNKKWYLFYISSKKFFNQSCFSLQIRNNANQDETKKKRKTKNEVKNELIASLQECEVVESKELDRRAQSITQYVQAISVNKDYN